MSNRKISIDNYSVKIGDRIFPNIMPAILVAMDDDGNFYTVKLNESRITVESEDPLNKYKPAQYDDAGDPTYYGFTDKDENWYILKISSADKDFKYVKGQYNYNQAWMDKGIQSYDFYHNVFKGGK